MTTSADETTSGDIPRDAVRDRRAFARLQALRLARRPEPRGRNWAIVLAGGEGNRLRRLTTDGFGTAVPKQFCSLRNGPSLLHDALHRAENLAPRRRICAVVARQHARWWRESLSSLPFANIVVQPENRGTAVGILLALLHVLERDPLARVLVLPSDHHVTNEPALSAAMARAVVRLRKEPDAIVLLGMTPDDADTELGYIVPAPGGADDVARVASFIEKPSPPEARLLISRGALWNSFIIAAYGPALLGAFAARDPALVARMQAAVKSSRGGRDPAPLNGLYDVLPTLDFSRQIMQGREALLRVLRVPACGWNDLGTLEHVGKSLRGAASGPAPAVRGAPPLPGALSLEQQFARFGGL
jgi:mannose-1-phosphate guanylyltransferase